LRTVRFRERKAAIRLAGNTTGLKPLALRRLERIAARRNRSNQIVSPELARTLCELSYEIQRQIGLLIDRKGDVRILVVGDARSVFLPDLSAYRQGFGRFCGLRLVHTHLHAEGINDDDLTDLALLRLDMVAALMVASDGSPGDLHIAHLLPANPDGHPWVVLSPTSVHDLADDYSQMITALEREFAAKRQPRPAGDKRDRAILVHVSNSSRTHATDSVAELKQLAASAGLDVVDCVIQRRTPDRKHVLGKGKLQNTIIRAMQFDAEILVFDDDLSPAQVRELAVTTDLKVVDRTQLILDIFAQRAQTREGRIQVELAQLRYLLPRLGARHTALSRLAGGIGGRGPGETKLEIDRRRATQRIAALQREIVKLGNRRRLRRKTRIENKVPNIAIVGYTNAGKSTLLNQLTRSEVSAEDTLFATLSPVSRRLRFPQEKEIVITDTVGFIRRLPAELMAAFRTTFEEMEPANLLLHVLDASNPEVDTHAATVRAVLTELKMVDKPMLHVINKADKCDAGMLKGLVERYDAVAISALDTQTFAPLLDALFGLLWPGEIRPPEREGAGPMPGSHVAGGRSRNAV